MKVTTEFCYALNGSGRAKAVSLNSISHQTKGPVWVHIDYANEKNQKWLQNQKLSSSVLENLLDSDTTPRYFKEKRGTLIVLRGINTDAQEQDNMIALHIWMTPNRLLTLSHRSLPTITKILQELKSISFFIISQSSLYLNLLIMFYYFLLVLLCYFYSLNFL